MFAKAYGRRRLARLLSLLLTCVAAHHAAAQVDSSVVVTATRTPVRVNEVVAEVTVIDRAMLDRAAGRTLVELLSQQAGLQFSSSGGLGKNASLFIRGLQSRHTLLLVDGVRVGSATSGTPSLDNLPLEAVDRIEIVRGPMSSLYGSGAMGGVIQVFLRRGSQGVTANALASAGSHGYGQVAGGATYGNGSIDAAVQVQRTYVQGVSATNDKEPFGAFNPDRDGFGQTGGGLRLGWRPTADWRLELLGLHSRGVTRIDDGPGVDARARLSNDVVGISASGRVSAGWQMRLSASESVDGYDTLSTADPFSPLGLIESRIRQLSWENTVATPLGNALLMVERQSESVSRPGEPFTVSRRDIDAVALGLDGGAGPHAWNASLRHDRNSQFGGATTGAAAYGYALSPAWRLGATYGTSFGAPSFGDLYFPGFSNPLLRPETGRHGELSLQWTASGHSVRATYFDNRYRGFITSGATPANLPRTRIDGVTLAYEGRWRDLAMSAALDHIDPRNNTAGSASFGKQLPRRAQDALRLGVDWTRGPWSAGATLAAFSSRYDDAANTARLAGYATLDLRAEWTVSRELALGLKLNNAGDKAYETALGYDQPRRETFVTLRYTPK
ncbi:TonB-dependent receptor [Rubrivivax sp. A210]|uniref:TonB-dependent receptor domain-containing protein n=1 Tax=Rubrivivax sp. A210 TaxID=2772301 RepID=UPI00191877A3|nr:TonB-dependent receptor [Rubrivivax sp. A210]CAD5374566.1 TonB-dependent receptor [Rubrivivax sp. A210]